MKIIYKSVEDLVPYVNNPKDHPPKQIDKIASSIKEFGFKVPILITDDDVIVAGHGRLEASKKLGLDEVPCIVAKDLTESQIKAFRIADNRIAESGWDEELLSIELEELDDVGFDLGLMGFEEDEIEALYIDNDDKSGPVNGEVEFTTELMEQNQYVVFYFDNILDWNVVKDNLGIGTVKALDSKEGYEREGVGRVLSGDILLELIEGH